MADQTRMETAEVPTIVERVLRMRPWASPAFVIGYQIRRWIFTLWVAALCWALSLPLALSICTVAAAILVDVVWIGRAYDLRIGHREFITGLATQSRLGNSGLDQFRRFLKITGFFVILLPIALLLFFHLVELLTQGRAVDELNPWFIPIAGISFTVAAAYASAEIVHSFLGNYENRQADYFVSVVVPASNVSLEDIISETTWINFHLTLVTGITIAGMAIFVAGIRGLQLDGGNWLLALLVFAILYLCFAGYIFGFWLYRARLFAHLIRKLQTSAQE